MVESCGEVWVAGEGSGQAGSGRPGCSAGRCHVGQDWQDGRWVDVREGGSKCHHSSINNLLPSHASNVSMGPSATGTGGWEVGMQGGCGAAGSISSAHIQRIHALQGSSPINSQPPNEMPCINHH